MPKSQSNQNSARPEVTVTGDLSISLTQSALDQLSNFPTTYIVQPQCIVTVGSRIIPHDTENDERLTTECLLDLVIEAMGDA